jgi:hypothetical protein
MSANEHDITKLMLETMRTKSSSHKNLIKENEEFAAEAPAVDTETDEENFETGMDDIEREKFESNKEEFKDKVTKGAAFDKFSIDKETQSVSFGGRLRNGMEWSYSYSKTGGTNAVELGTPVGSRYVKFGREDLKILNSLVNYYDVWVGRWDDEFDDDSMLKT